MGPVTSLRPVADDHLPGGGALVGASWQVDCNGPVRVGAPVTHGHAALVFCTGGESRVDLRGEWELREGDLLLVPAGEPHRMLRSRRLERWALGFSVSAFASGDVAPLLEPLERVREGASAVVRIPSARHEYLGGLFRELERVGRSPPGASKGSEAVERSLLTLVLAEVERAAGTAELLPSSGGGVVGRALRYIERNCLRPLTLVEVAAAIGRSPAHVTTALTRATGRSAVQWIVSGRMVEARRRLRHSDDRIDVVAERVGYADPTHFIRMFRREHGVTPAAWRALQARASRVGP